MDLREVPTLLYDKVIVKVFLCQNHSIFHLYIIYVDDYFEQMKQLSLEVTINRLWF